MTDENAPKFGELVLLQKDGWENIPDSPNPYYLAASDGMFTHKRMLTGRGIVRMQNMPPSFKATGHPAGAFHFEANPVPKELMAQVVDFFTTVYDRQHTEAAVLLTMHAETKEWRIFVPTQLLSHGGVNYVFEPTHIRYPWVLVGSIHSHCDFGAGHSGTDTNDADGFDGLHMTIGMLKKNDPPQIVAMVAMNKKLFHYKEEQFPMLFDWSDVRCAKAPDWWYRYCEDTKTKTKPVGFELYAKYDRPTVVKAEAAKTTIKQLPPSPGYQPTGYNTNDWYYHTELKRMVHKNWVINEDLSISYPSREDALVGKGQHGLTVVQRGTGDYIQGVGYSGAPRDTHTPDDWDDFYRLLGIEEGPEDFKGTSPEDLIKQGYSWDADLKTWVWTNGAQADSLEGLSNAILNESRAFNARKEAERGVNWDTEGAMRVRPPNEEELEALGIRRIQEDKNWEDALPDEFVNALIDSNLVTEEDLDFALRSPETAGTMEFWRHNIMRKALVAAELLQDMGIQAKVHVRMGPPPKDIEAVLLPPDGAQPPQQMQPGVH